VSDSRPFVAGVDSSTQSCKIVICDPASGKIIREGRASHPEGSEVDPQAWWEAFLEAVRAAGGLDDGRALSGGGQQHGMVCLDERGEVIRPALLWNDTRSAEAARELILERGDGDSETGARWWAQATGLVPVASFTVTKLRWVADNEAENARKIAAICLPHDWLSWKIRGGFEAVGLEGLCTDRSDASGTGYMDRADAVYRREILAQALRISLEEAEAIILPKICDPVEAMGFGDPRHGWGEIAIGPGCGDNAGAALGVGLGVGQALLSLGTSGVVAVVSETPVEDPSGQVAGFADASGHWLPLACTLNASRILDAVGAEAGPVILAGHDDGGLLVAEALNEGEGFRVLGDVDLLVGDALLVEGAVGRVALGAAGLGVDGDRHVRVSLRLEAGRWHPVLSFWRLVRREHDNTTPRGRPRKRPLDVVCAAPTVDEVQGVCGWSERSGSRRDLQGLSPPRHGCAQMRANIGVCD